MEIKEYKEPHPLANVKEKRRKPRKKPPKHSKYGALAIIGLERRYKKIQKKKGTYKKEKRDKALNAADLIGDIIEIIFDLLD